MCKVARLTPITLALLLLACGKADPVADDAVGPPDELVGDASATGLAAPANAAAALGELGRCQSHRPPALRNRL